MAVTKIHPIKLTVDRAIKYVTNPNKTNEYALVDTYLCGVDTAAINFEATVAQARDHKNSNKAFHLIQSFVPTEITPEEAHKIGKELCDKLLGGRYSYVIGTHVDKHHIHNHIVFCAVDNIDHMKFDNRKATMYKIRELSDQLCEEHGLDVITPDKQAKGYYKGKGKQYKEWLEDGKGKSWKTKIRDDVRSTIRESKTYDEFIEKIKALGYELKGTKLDGSEGKYLEFKAPGQNRFTRGRETSTSKGLGKEFTREAIASKIKERERKHQERIAKLKEDNKLRYINTNTEKMKESPGLANWAHRENRQRMTKVYSELAELGIGSIDALAERIDGLKTRIENNTSKLNELDEKMKGYAEIIGILETYKTNKKYYDAYQRSADPERYLESRLSEITMFQQAEKLCKQHGIDPSKYNVTALREEYGKMESQKANLNGQIRRDRDEIKKLDKYLTDLRAWMNEDKMSDIKPDKSKDQSL